MKNILKIFILLFLILTPLTALGYDGNDWVQHHEKNDFDDIMLKGYLIGYIHGKRDAGLYVRYLIKEGDLILSKSKYGYSFNLYLMDTYNYICTKDGVTNSQIVAIVDNYIRKNPQDWHKNLTDLIDSALGGSKIYECSTRNYGDDNLEMLQYIKHSY